MRSSESEDDVNLLWSAVASLAALVSTSAALIFAPVLLSWILLPVLTVACALGASLLGRCRSSWHIPLLAAVGGAIPLGVWVATNIGRDAPPNLALVAVVFWCVTFVVVVGGLSWLLVSLLANQR